MNVNPKTSLTYTISTDWLDDVVGASFLVNAMPYVVVRWRKTVVVRISSARGSCAFHPIQSTVVVANLHHHQSKVRFNNNNNCNVQH